MAKLLISVHIGPHHELGQSADFNRAEAWCVSFRRRWDHTERPKFGRNSWIALEAGSEAYDRLRSAFLRDARGSMNLGVSWNETWMATYEPAELQAAEYLRLQVKGSENPSSPHDELNTFYDVTECPTCGLLQVNDQLRNLVFDLSSIRSDFVWTGGWVPQLIVSDAAVNLLSEWVPQWIDFRPVEEARATRRRRRYYQLVASTIVSPILTDLPPDAPICVTCNRIYSVAQPSVHPDALTEVLKFPGGPWDEFKVWRPELRHAPIVRTADLYGGAGKPGMRAPRFPAWIIHQEVFQKLKASKLTNWGVQPAVVLEQRPRGRSISGAYIQR